MGLISLVLNGRKNRECVDISACVQGIRLKIGCRTSIFDASELPFLACGPAAVWNPAQHCPIPQFKFCCSFILYIILMYFIIFWFNKSNISRIVTGHQFACTLPWRKPEAEVAWETTSQEERTAGARKKRHSPALVKASGRGACRAPSAAAQTNTRSCSLCTFTSAEAQQGLPGARELLRELHPALPWSHFDPCSCAGSSSLCRSVSRSQPSSTWGSDPGAAGTGPGQQLWQKCCSPREQVPQCSSKVSGYQDSATCPVLFLEPCLGVALLQKIKRIFTVM